MKCIICLKKEADRRITKVVEKNVDGTERVINEYSEMMICSSCLKKIITNKMLIRKE